MKKTLQKERKSFSVDDERKKKFEAIIRPFVIYDFIQLSATFTEDTPMNSH